MVSDEILDVRHQISDFRRETFVVMKFRDVRFE